MTHVQAQADAGSWKLPANDIWNVPEGVHQVHHELELGSGFHRPLMSITALVIDLKGRIYGVRKMSRPRESGYQQEGRVSVGGLKVRAFTGSKLFERPDGSLCDVGVLIISTKAAERLHGGE